MARIREQITKWVPIPNDTDDARIEFKLLKPGVEKRLDMQGIEITGKVSADAAQSSEDIQYKMPPLFSRNIDWMVEVFANWENMFDLKGTQAPCDRNSIILFQDNLEIQWSDEEGKTQTGTLHEWAAFEYDKLRQEHSGEQEKAEGN